MKPFFHYDNKIVKSISILAVVIAPNLLLLSCGKEKPIPFIDKTPYLEARNGLSDSQRKEFYHLSEGGDFIPRYIFDALQRADGGKFAEKMHEYGFIQDPLMEKGSELPIGVSVAKSKILGIEMVGFSCAACHVSDIHYKGKRIRIDGAPNTLNVYPFYSDVLEAAEKSLNDGEKMFQMFKKAGFLKDSTREILDEHATMKSLEEKSELSKGISDKLNELNQSEIGQLNEAYVKQGRSHLETKLFGALDQKDIRVDQHVESLFPLNQESGLLGETSSRKGKLRDLFNDYLTHLRLMWGHVEWLRKYVASNEVHGGTPLGHGRVDAFGTARNLIFLEVEDYLPCTAPVSIPHLWGFKENRWLHWNANTNTVMQRNIIQALGTGAVVDPKTLATSIHFENLDRLDALAGLSTSPAWPTELLGSIDELKAARGKIIYTEKCGYCHDAGKRVDGFFEYPLFALSDGSVPVDEKVSTDPMQARNFNREVNGKSFAQSVFETAEKIEKRYYDANRISEEQQRKWQGAGRGDRQWRSPLSDTNTKPPTQPAYPARGLAGTWATAPYLHNGSVPNMFSLLSNANERPTVFTVGLREYDPVKMGFEQQDTPKASHTFDTTLPGNSAVGHEFGTDLSTDEKYDLIEYLKTL
jgi:hypothetical protein